MESTRKVFTLTELGKSIRSVIEHSYTSTYWIKAEIAKLNYYPRSGHCYPELVDKSGNVIQAQMRAVIWAADYKMINRQFTAAAGEPLREGMSILFRASLGFHPVYGLSLQIWEVELAFTLGEMAMEKTRNIEKLKKEGVFNTNKALSMPLLPKRIAVISVETSKGYSDFLKILSGQAEKYAWWHFLFPSVLQGDKAAEGIISQLRIIRKAKQRFDMIAIIRGGGGDIGLNCYDDYQLAKEIATSPLPVITGIGHATNETIAEMVAWSNKITPTDVAYFIVEQFKTFEQRIENASRAMRSKTLSLLAFQNNILDHLSNSTARNPAYLIASQKNKLDSITSSLLRDTRAMQQVHKDNLHDKALKMSLIIPRLLFKVQCDVDNHQIRLSTLAKQFFVKENSLIENLQTKRELLDPLNVLKRGYSITLHNGKSLKKATDVKEGDELVTRLSEGSLKTRVIG
ncbi:MAG: exodeoxyribonuclease VII large subunit [Bacteroidetes bacterium]|nr:MAG: exodeoxyribonuclease VII large subunit [Bacteroidota bacterium]